MPATLQVEVYTSRAKLPIQDATVLITQRAPDGRHILLSIQKTNSSCFTTPIEIPTPPLENSTEPDPDGKIFTQCDVWVESPSFEMLLAEQVQVFPNTANLQPMALVPLPEGERSLASTEINLISPQNL